LPRTHADLGITHRGTSWRKEPGLEGYEKLKKILADIEDDVKKAAGGNKAAGTRVRQAMQDIKETAQAVRQAILELRAKDGEQ
jgi:hypothetical protein